MKEKVKELEAKLKRLKRASKNKVDTLIELAWEVWILEVKRSMQLSQEALEMAEKIGYEKGIAYAHRNLGMLYSSGADVEKGMFYLSKALMCFILYSKSLVVIFFVEQ